MNLGTQRFDINWIEIRKVIKNAAIFLGPALIIFLEMIQSGRSVEEAFIAIKVWSINVLIDFIRKAVSDNSQKQP